MIFSETSIELIQVSQELCVRKRCSTSMLHKITIHNDPKRIEEISFDDFWRLNHWGSTIPVKG